jgi:hypothetical protein
MAGFSIALVWDQSRKITSFEPVAAKVLSKEIREHVSRSSEGGTRRNYEPLIRYEYEVEGRRYVSTTVAPVLQARSKKWAKNILDRYAEGQETTAYYDPEYPSESFLLAAWSFLPHLGVLVAMSIIGLLYRFRLGYQPSRQIAGKPKLRGLDTCELRTSSSAKRAGFISLGLSVGWVLVGAAAAGHYFVKADRPYELVAYAGSSVYAILSLVVLARGINDLSSATRLIEERVFVEESRFCLGDELHVRLKYKLFKWARMQKARIGLVLRVRRIVSAGKKYEHSLEPDFEQRHTVFEHQGSEPGGSFEFSCEFKIPEDKEPSSPRRQKDFPRYEWGLEVVVDASELVRHTTVFPILVEPAGFR